MAFYNSTAFSRVCWWPKKPRAKKYDPFFSDDEEDEEKPKGKPVRLEGNAPTPFDGDRSKTEYFLAEFRRYMRLITTPP
jgi:hypothetical protein